MSTLVLNGASCHLLHSNSALPECDTNARDQLVEPRYTMSCPCQLHVGFTSAI